MKSSPLERKRLPLGIVVLGIAFMICTSIAPAQEFPTKPARLVVPFAAGGGADLNARRLAVRLENVWKQPVVVQNIGGGAGNLAAVAVANSEPDGYTMFFASLPIFVTNPVIYPKLPFDPDRDFTPVILMSETPHLLVVSAAFRATTLPQLIALAKERPGTLNFGSGGQGTSQHLAGELLKSIAGINLVHVPYKGAALAITAMLSGEIHMLFDNASAALGQIRGGRVRGLAIASKTRAVALPEVPTFAEGGVANFYTSIPYGIFVRAGTPAAVVSAINRTLNAVFQEPEYKKQMTELGANLMGGVPKDLTAFIAAERKKWLPLIQRQGIKAY